ncbi:hypothetical protein JCM11251_003308 [Rhodosporidiobolus azoricus]
MDEYLTSTKPSTSRAASVQPGAGRQNPYSSLNLATKDIVHGKDTSLGGGIERINKAIIKTLGKEDNPVTNSTASSRTLHVSSCSTGHQSGGGSSGKWTLHRNAKLRIQSKGEESQALNGVVAYISGYTGRGITNTELKELVERMGGVVKTMPGGRITHTFVLDHLSGSKTQKILDANKKSRVSKMVLPEWAIECARKGRRVDEAKFIAPILSEVQESAYTIFQNLAFDRRSASSSGASTSRSCFISPPLASTSRADPLLVPSTSSSSEPKKEEKSATALLLSHIDARKANQTPSPQRPKRGKKRPCTATLADGEVELSPKKKGKKGKGKEVKKEREEVIVLGSSDVEVEDSIDREKQPIKRVLSDAWAGLGEPEGAKDSDDDGLDDWGMPPSGQGRGGCGG